MSEVVSIQAARDLCAECQAGRHVYCLDDGSSTVECECPCSDDFWPESEGVGGGDG